MHSNPAPRVDDELTRVAAAPSELADDPVRRLLGGPSDPVRHLGLRHWLGLLGLVAAIAVAAFVMPPLIAPATPPAPRPAAAPLPSTAPSSPAGPGSPLAAAPSDPATTVTEVPPTRGAPRTTPAQPVASGPAPTTRPAPSASGDTTRKFHAITVQAETGSLSQGASPVDCGTCQSGARVRFVGRVDVHATIPAPGTYAMTVVYEVDGSRTLDVSVNGRPPVATRTVTGHSWTTPLSLTVRAALPAGPIDIGLYGDGGNAPDIDAVTIS